MARRKPSGYARRMRRRDFIALLGGTAAVWPASLHAQPAGKPVRIGVFAGSPDNPIMGPAYSGFLEDLRKLGFGEGQNLTVEFGRSDQDFSALSAAAKEMVRSKVDVLVALGAEPALKAAISASRTIPIVFVANNYDPIALGYVSSLAKPGGNVTGIFLRQTELAEKQVELLHEASPTESGWPCSGTIFRPASLPPPSSGQNCWGCTCAR